MLRRDYLGSILVCTLLFSLVGLGIYKRISCRFKFVFKSCWFIVLIAIFIGFIT